MFVIEVSIIFLCSKQPTGFPGASKEDNISSEVVDTDPAGFHDQVRMF